MTSGGPTVSSTKPRLRVPTGGEDIGWAPGRGPGPGPTHHPQGSPSSSSSWAAPGAELDGMVGVGDVGLFGGQRWKERDRGARSQGLSSSNTPSTGMALPGASAPTPPTEHFPQTHPARPPPHLGCRPGGPICLHLVPLGGPSLELSLLTPSLCECRPPMPSPCVLLIPSGFKRIVFISDMIQSSSVSRGEFFRHATHTLETHM